MPPAGWRADVKERFEKYVMPEPMSGCWLWDGSDDGGAGYGRFRIPDENINQAHHASLLIYKKLRVPKGLEVDHTCRIPSCVNPDHLEIVTRLENMRRVPLEAIKAQRRISGAANGARQRAKTHCPHGHSYENPVLSKQGYRACRTCWNAKVKRQAAARKLRLQLKGE